MKPQPQTDKDKRAEWALFWCCSGWPHIVCRMGANAPWHHLTGPYAGQKVKYNPDGSWQYPQSGEIVFLPPFPCFYVLEPDGALLAFENRALAMERSILHYLRQIKFDTGK